MQQKLLAMNQLWPLRVGPEKQRVLDQGHGAPQLDGGMIREQLVRINEGDLHAIRRFLRPNDRPAAPEQWRNPDQPVRHED